MRAVQITRFGGPEVMDVVDLPDPTPGEGEQLYDVSAAGVNFADTHHRLSFEVHQTCDASEHASAARRTDPVAGAQSGKPTSERPSGSSFVRACPSGNFPWKNVPLR
jgi:hypothetical protein